MDLRKLKKLIDLVQESGIGEIEITEGEEKVRISRQLASQPMIMAAPAMQPMMAPGMMAAPQAGGPAAAAEFPRAPEAAQPAGHQLKSPMVGTFYRAPSPDAPPFVEVGSVVSVGQPLCLIELMKLFTTINSEFDGRIVQVGAENGELVEYGRVLFVIDPA